MVKGQGLQWSIFLSTQVRDVAPGKLFTTFSCRATPPSIGLLCAVYKKFIPRPICKPWFILLNRKATFVSCVLVQRTTWTPNASFPTPPPDSKACLINCTFRTTLDFPKKTSSSPSINKPVFRLCNRERTIERVYHQSPGRNLPAF